MDKLQKIKRRKRQLIVDCPKWIQRRIFRNLEETARSKINSGRARQAQAILDAIKKEPTKGVSKADAGRAKVKAAKPKHNRVDSSLRVPVTKGHYTRVVAGGCSDVLPAVLRRKNPMRRHKLGINQ